MGPERHEYALHAEALYPDTRDPASVGNDNNHKIREHNNADPGRARDFYNTDMQYRGIYQEAHIDFRLLGFQRGVRVDHGRAVVLERLKRRPALPRLGDSGQVHALLPAGDGSGRLQNIPV
jgi:hypothetical protein